MQDNCPISIWDFVHVSKTNVIVNCWQTMLVLHVACWIWRIALYQKGGFLAYTVSYIVLVAIQKEQKKGKLYKIVGLWSGDLLIVLGGICKTYNWLSQGKTICYSEF